MTRPVREERGFFSIDGMQLEFLLLTPPQSSELTLLLLHEGLGCVAMWKDFPLRLAQRNGCRVLTYSRAGYGRSSPCSLPRPLSFMHDEGLEILPKIIATAGIGDHLLLGHSDGASIALINAGGRADRRLRGLILMAPHVFVEDLTLSSIRQAVTDYETGNLRTRLRRYHGDNVDCAFRGWSGAWLDPEFRNWNLEAYLAQIEAPVLLLQGEDDNYGTLRQPALIRQQVPQGADQLILPNCGHAPFRDQPDQTLQAVAEFLTKLR